MSRLIQKSLRKSRAGDDNQVETGGGSPIKIPRPANNLHNTIHHTDTPRISRQGFLTPAQENAAINFNNARYDERSIRIFQIITGAAVDGQFGRVSAEAVAGFQHANGLGVDGQVGENTLNAMVPNRAAAGRQEHAIQIVVDFYNLNVTRDTLTVHFDPALAVAGPRLFNRAT